MKRKLLAYSLFLFLIIIPVNSYANYFTDNPHRFINYFTSEQYTSYADINSVNVIRYNPPYYVIDVTTYTFDYVNQVIFATVERFYYNYDKQTMRVSLIKTAMASDDGTSGLDNAKALPTGVYNIDDMPIIKKFTPEYLLGETAFMKAYRMFFTKEFNTQTY